MVCFDLSQPPCHHKNCRRTLSDSKMLQEQIQKLLIDSEVSDIHLAVNDSIWMRRGGVMNRVGQLGEMIDDASMRHFLGGLLGNSTRTVDVILDEERGSYDFGVTLGEFRLRCNLFRQNGNLGMVMRRLRDQIPDLNELGLPETVKALAQRSRGLLLVTGATGSGKSTTLASIMKYINQNHSHHILTIEDPVEYLLQSDKCKITRRELGRDTPTFERGVRAAMREDPDVIVVGELRDKETMHAALAAAETGHLVLATLHTVNAKQTIQRVTSFFTGEEQEWACNVLATVLNGVISQCLVPTVEGVHQRTLCYELMVNTPAVRSNIADNKISHIGNVMETGRQDGQVLLQWSLVEKVRSGLISRESAMYFSYDQKAMEREIG